MIYTVYMDDEETIELAAQWMKENREQVLKDIVLNQSPMYEKGCIFMAGSAGAGKTETIRRMELEKQFIILDVDEIRIRNKYYEKTEVGKKGNAHLIQKAAGKGLDYCREYCIKHGIAFVQDATFSNDGSIKLVKKLLKNGWSITILYIYQNPEMAWRFTEARERLEGRNITKDNFVRSFTNSITNIEKVQDQFPGTEVFLIIKNGLETRKRIKLSKIKVKSALAENHIDIPTEGDILKLLNKKDI